MLQTGRQIARGDENNADVHGVLPAYRIFNAEAGKSLGGGWSLLARVENLLDRRDESFAILGANVFASGTADPWRAAHRLAAPRLFFSKVAALPNSVARTGKTIASSWPSLGLFPFKAFGN